MPGGAPIHTLAELGSAAGGSLAIVPDAPLHAAEVWKTLTLRAGFNTSTVILGTTLLGLAAGIVGVFALLRKRSLVTDALSHATLPGIALAFLLAPGLGVGGRSLPLLLLGATASAALSVLCIQLILRHTRLREDAAIGIVLSVFFGAGVVGLSYIQKNAPAGAAGLSHFIFGQTAAMSVGDATLMGSIALVAIGAALLFFKEFSLACFNDAFARVQGWPVSLIDLAMMALVVLVTVAGLQAVGLVLVVAMLIIPPVAARFWSERLWVLVALAGVFGASSGYLGAVVSALLPGKPAGAVIVLTAGVIFSLSMLLAPSRGVVASTARRLHLRLRMAGDHLLEAAHESASKTDLAPGEGVVTPDDLRSLARLRGWPPWFGPLVVHALTHGGMLSRRPGRGLALTEAGRERGARVRRNHTLWSQYLITYADIAPTHVDWSVDQVEHVLSDTLIAELERALERRGVALPPRAGSTP